MLQALIFYYVAFLMYALQARAECEALCLYALKKDIRID